MIRRFARKRDIFIIVGIIAAAAIFMLGKTLFFSQSSSAAEAVIYYDSQIVETIALQSAPDKTFPVPGQPGVVLQVKDGAIRFYSSTCRDKICVNAGFLSKPGQMAACLPNRVAVEIVAVKGAGSSDGPDTYAF